MYDEVLRHYPQCDIVIGAAAVADYRPKAYSGQKVKKKEGDLVIELARNPDILAELGKKKGNHILVGFAAETEDLLVNAQAKMDKKNLDVLIANDVTQEGAGFGSDTNIVTIMARDSEPLPLPQMLKGQLAAVILDKIAGLF